MEIRKAQLADIFEITNILIEEMYEEVGVGKPLRAKVLDYITYLHEDGIMYVAETNVVKKDGTGKELAGMTGAHISQWWWSDQDFLSEDFTFVRKKFRKGRLALNLMKKLDTYAKKLKMPLVTGIFNDVEHERKNKLFSKLYQHFGYIYLGGDLKVIGRS